MSATDDILTDADLDALLVALYRREDVRMLLRTLYDLSVTEGLRDHHAGMVAHIALDPGAAPGPTRRHPMPYADCPPITDADFLWRQKASRVIGELCTAAYHEAQQSKRPRRRGKHVPYAVPQLAAQLVECLNRNDAEAAKAIFLALAYREPDDHDPA